MAFTKKIQTVEGDEFANSNSCGTEAVVAPVPTKFVMLPGADRSFKLLDDTVEILADRSRHVQRGVVIQGHPLPGHQHVRMVDITRNPYCLHPPVNPGEKPQDAKARAIRLVAGLIMDNWRFTGIKVIDSEEVEVEPVVYTYEDWRRLQEVEAEVKAESAERIKNERALIRGKFGKRGADPSQTMQQV